MKEIGPKEREHGIFNEDGTFKGYKDTIIVWCVYARDVTEEEAAHILALMHAHMREAVCYALWSKSICYVDGQIKFDMRPFHPKFPRWLKSMNSFDHGFCQGALATLRSGRGLAARCANCDDE